MNALMSSRPRRGSCSEYLSSMSGAAISSTTPSLTPLPQNSVNQRPTVALLSSSLLIGMAPRDSSREDHRHRDDLKRRLTRDVSEPNSGSCPGIETTDHGDDEDDERRAGAVKLAGRGLAFQRSRANPRPFAMEHSSLRTISRVEYRSVAVFACQSVDVRRTRQSQSLRGRGTGDVRQTSLAQDVAKMDGGGRGRRAVAAAQAQAHLADRRQWDFLRLEHGGALGHALRCAQGDAEPGDDCCPQP